MSTTVAPAAGSPAAPAAGTATLPKTPSVTADIRRRAMGLPSLTPEQTAEEKAKADKVAADKKAADDKAAADKLAADAAAAAAAAPPADKVKKVKAGPPLPDPAAPAPGKSVDELVREALAKEKETGAPAAPAVNPEIEREIELAKVAAKKNPDRYAGFPDKILGFYSSRDQLLAGKAKELGGHNSSEFKDYVESDEFKEWVRVNRPTYARGDVARFQEDMIADRARAEARDEMAPTLKAQERKINELRHAPDIAARTNTAVQIVITDPSAEKDPALVEFAKDPRKFSEEHPDEARLIGQEAAQAAELISEVYRIDRDLVDFNPARPTPTQLEINRFMVQQNDTMRQKYPSGIQMADGKILVDAETYRDPRLKLGSDARYRTFTADEIAGMLAAQRNADVLRKLKERREGVAKSVYAPKTAAPPAQVVAPPARPDDAQPVPDAVASRASGGKGKPVETEWKKMKKRYLNGSG